jgi:hypothetical protein
MLWLRVSLLTNVTWAPGLTMIAAGFTPAGVMVIVVVSTPGPAGGVGSDGELPPHAAAAKSNAPKACLTYV